MLKYVHSVIVKSSRQAESTLLQNTTVNKVFTLSMDKIKGENILKYKNDKN